MGSTRNNGVRFEIRRYRPADKQGVADTILPIQREEFGIPITAEDQPDLAAIEAFYQTGKGDFWVAVTGEDGSPTGEGKVIGTIALKDIGDHQAALRKMFVAAPYRGRNLGVAARLLETLLAAARQRGLRRIYLGTTAKFLAAHRFYEKHGFTEVTPDALPASFPRMAVDTKFYTIELG
ncbi:GNAT family N-acetyltransferase [Bordetella genomosp. 10]|uniref:GNAT family N-acetyltransferase n=1 Tax=Bordetella genomosp. 10 TaxID=1416804 RepID=A0A261SJF6_9BORD|nr:GNAT family N-acetyltransferase [Bordetella genomosp. 10]OZI37161.1 GNAT family N-acetyltransferase [Bordetella genomosp. 10]